MSVYTRTEAAEHAKELISLLLDFVATHVRLGRPPAHQNVGRNSKANERLFVRKYAIALPKLARSVGPSRSVDPCNSSHDIHTTRKRTSPPAPVINATFFLAVLFHPSVCLSSPFLALFLVRPVSSPRGNTSYRVSWLR